MAQKTIHALDHRNMLLRGGGAIEVAQFLAIDTVVETGKFRAQRSHIIKGGEGHGSSARVRANCWWAKAWAASEEKPWAISSKNPSISRLRAVTVSRPRLRR